MPAFPPSMKGVRSLLHLAYAVPERKGTRRTTERLSFLERMGTDVLLNAVRTLRVSAGLEQESAVP